MRPPPTAHRIARWTFPALLPLLLASAPAWAQPAGDRPAEVEGGLGAYSLVGDDFPDIGVGPGLEAGIRARLGRRLSLGAGIHHSWHSAPRLAASFRVLSLHLEPRVHLAPLPVLPKARPYVGVRTGYATWEAHERSDRFRAEITARGFRTAGIAGVALPVRPGLDLDLSLEAGYLRFGDPQIEARSEDGGAGEAAAPAGSATDGLLLGVRTSLRADLPWP